MKNLLYLSVLVLLAACNKSNVKATAPADTGQIGTGNVEYEDVNIADFKVEDVPETGWQRAVKLDSLGALAEEGFFENGKKVGSWITYWPGKLFPQQISNYKNGKLNGLHLQFNQGGAIELVAHYQNNQLHGAWAKYRFARVLEQANYKDGKMDGEYKIYNLADGKLVKSAEYKDGIQDGYYRTYDPDGKVTTEYLYRNGEVVNGGSKN